MPVFLQGIVLIMQWLPVQKRSKTTHSWRSLIAFLHDWLFSTSLWPRRKHPQVMTHAERQEVGCSESGWFLLLHILWGRGCKKTLWIAIQEKECFSYQDFMGTSGSQDCWMQCVPKQRYPLQIQSTLSKGIASIFSLGGIWGIMVRFGRGGCIET